MVAIIYNYAARFFPRRVRSTVGHEEFDRLRILGADPGFTILGLLCEVWRDEGDYMALGAAPTPIAACEFVATFHNPDAYQMTNEIMVAMLSEFEELDEWERQVHYKPIDAKKVRAILRVGHLQRDPLIRKRLGIVGVDLLTDILESRRIALVMWDYYINYDTPEEIGVERGVTGARIRGMIRAGRVRLEQFVQK